VVLCSSAAPVGTTTAHRHVALVMAVAALLARLADLRPERHIPDQNTAFGCLYDALARQVGDRGSVLFFSGFSVKLIWALVA